MKTPERPGVFIVSLDFELHWGVHDKRSVESYKQNLLGVRTVVPALLQMFTEYGIHATWATVGFLFCETREELLASLPVRRPRYAQSQLDPYSKLDNIGRDEASDPFHFAPSLIRLIQAFPGQELGTHTFSHYLPLAEGQDGAAFEEDLEAAIRIARGFGVRFKSIVFPRNQINRAYLPICADHGILAYRGMAFGLQTRRSRLAEAARSYVTLGNHFDWELERGKVAATPVCLPYSSFLRPFSPEVRFLEPLRKRRVISDMRHAARNGLVYHLWWHPHNFGRHIAENCGVLEAILEEFRRLQKSTGFESLNMAEVAGRMLTGESDKTPSGHRAISVSASSHDPIDHTG